MQQLEDSIVRKQQLLNTPGLIGNQTGCNDNTVSVALLVVSFYFTWQALDQNRKNLGLKRTELSVSLTLYKEQIKLNISVFCLYTTPYIHN